MATAVTVRGHWSNWWLGAIGLLWVWAAAQLRADWDAHPQYAFGYAVPLLSAFLAWLRWEDRPPISQPTGGAGWINAAWFLAAASLLPLAIIREANPDWRLASWTLGLACISLTMGVVHRVGGPAWARHFAFPIGFFLIAVPWPAGMEQAVIQTLTRWNAGVVVDLLVLAGIPVVQQGNLLEIRWGPVGIDEACSGIRSFQATLMISLFLGEFYRFRPFQRVALVIAGASISFLCNIGRTLLLVWVCHQNGMEALDRWHDPAGIGVLIACFATLFGVAWNWSRGMETAEMPKAETLKGGDGGERGATSADPEGRVRPMGAPGPGMAVGLILWLLSVAGATEAWFRWHERSVVDQPQWTVTWPPPRRGWREMAIPERATAILRYNESRSATWRDPDGTLWHQFFFVWKPSRVSAQLARGHTPEICLPASGRTLRAQPGRKTYRAGALDIPFDRYVFDDRGRTLHVFYCLWDDRPRTGPAIRQDWSRSSRLLAAWHGHRNLGQRVLEVAIWGAADLTEAERAFAKVLPELIHPPTPVGQDSVAP